MIDSLAEEFAGSFSRETIQQCASDSYESLQPGVVADFIPVLVYRFTRERLRAQLQAGGQVHKDKPEVLFVCVHNAGRSQMAAVLTEALSGGRVSVRSAGSAPAGEINPVVVQVMNEHGMDLAQEFPKPLTDEAVEAADVVVTMGCGDAFPVYPGKRYVDWQLDDPAGQPLDTVRRIRDDIEGRVRALLAELLAE
ncbi:MAG: phosphatase [Anaerolinea sp.]|nr:phosphatase [Anaerolinea sp.]